jgi:HSP20 family protein
MPLLPARRHRERGSPAGWDPWGELEEMHERMGRLIERTFGDEGWPRGDLAWAPLVDVEESDDAWVFEAELPGARREDVTIEVGDRELAIHGEIAERERTGIVHRRLRRTGRFDYRVTLPADVDGDQVQAELRDGVLTVRAQERADAAQAHRDQSG